MSNKDTAWSLAYQILGSMLIPIGLGYVFDKHYLTLPYGIMTGSIVGMISVFALLFKMIRNSK